MPKEKMPPPPPDDIPAWFMTYSDVITLLMTFFILLLTFSTTEPERFEKVQTAVHQSGGASGMVGPVSDGLTKDSWVTRIRPPSARVAVRGATMPPKMRVPVKKTFGEGVKALEESERRSDLASNHFFDSRLVELFTDEELNPEGKNVCSMLSHQLGALPVHLTIQYSDPRYIGKAVKMMDYMFYTKMTRPGQVALSFVKSEGIPPKSLRFVITRYDPLKGNR